MFGRLKDWRRLASRYDQCPEKFFLRYYALRNRLVLAVKLNESGL